MIAGFTGSQHGMTVAQLERIKLGLQRLLKHNPDLQAQHGDCIGADTQFDGLCKELGIPVSTRPTITSKRAYCASPALAEPKPQPA